MKNLFLSVLISLFFLLSIGCTNNKTDSLIKPRILISTDIGGTDPDDFQSMIHFMMYSDLFETEGLISSPSFGDGSVQNIYDIIDLYEKDLPKLRKHAPELSSPEYLRSITKQGRHGGAPYAGYGIPTEGSEWIIKCAQRESDRPLWVLVWGGLEDLAQALHDAPEIQHNIKVYWIGGPNKKWSANSYAYIAENFPDLWFIEANATYRGFFTNSNAPDSLHGKNYYNNYILGAGHMGEDFKNYYNGEIKMGDSPSLFYLMNGDPDNPLDESWGGSFEKFNHSPRTIFTGTTTTADTLSAYSIVEFHLKGPEIVLPSDQPCFNMNVYASIGEQKWDGYYLGEGNYAIRYAFKQAETIRYVINSDIPGFPQLKGELVVNNIWPGKRNPDDFILGDNWYTDRSDPNLFDKNWQGGKTILKWRSDILLDWAKRWEWLRQ